MYWIEYQSRFPSFCDVTENGREPPPLGDILDIKIVNLAKRLNKRGLTFKYSIGLFARSVNPFRFNELPSYRFRSCKIPEMKSPSLTVPYRVILSSFPMAYSSSSGNIAVIAVLAISAKKESTP